jgi:hypothetical protein
MGMLNEQSAVRSLTLGDVRLTYVVDGAMWLTPAGYFPGIPASYWEGDLPVLVDGHVAMSAGGLLVERDGRKLLIDAGLGPYRGSFGEPPYGGARARDPWPYSWSHVFHRVGRD